MSNESGIMEEIRCLTKKYPDISWFCIYELYGAVGMREYRDRLIANEKDRDK